VWAVQRQRVNFNLQRIPALLLLQISAKPQTLVFLSNNDAANFTLLQKFVLTDIMVLAEVYLKLIALCPLKPFHQLCNCQTVLETHNFTHACHIFICNERKEKKLLIFGFLLEFGNL
jgi:hypothetical protein